jgi:hypothetical protein
MRGRELERRHQNLVGLDDVSFLREVRRWLELAEREPLPRGLLADLREQYEREHEQHMRDEEDAVLDLLALRQHLDAALGATRDQPSPRPTGTGSRQATRLIADIRPRLRELRATAGTIAVAPLERRFEAIENARTRRQQALTQLMHDSPCGALQRLDWLAEELEAAHRPRVLVDPCPLPAETALHNAYASVRPLLRRALGAGLDRTRLTASEWRQVGHIVAAARADATRVHEAMMLQAGDPGWADPVLARAHVGASVQRPRDRCG